MIDDVSVEVLPWYRQFWPWFLFGLPGTVVVAGIITLLIAIEKADTLVDDDYYRSGLGINQNLLGQNHAQALGLEARFTFDVQRGTVELVLLGDFPAPSPESLPDQLAQYPERLLLEFSHPIRSEKDYALQLSAAGGNRFQIDTEQPGGLLTPGRWYLRLSDPNASRRWLLQSPQSFTLPMFEVGDIDGQLGTDNTVSHLVNYTIHAGSRSASQ